MHEIILTQNTKILERMAAATINSLSGAAMHLFPNLYVRPSTLFMKGIGKRNLTVVEIGTDKGYNAKTILDNLDVGVMYLIDPYLESSLQGSSIAFEMAKKRLKKHKEKIHFVKQKSEDAVDGIPQGIDFLYIDGNHARKQVALELNLFYPKMRSGGVIAGHDFMGGHIDLAEAVVEFSMKRKLKLYGGSYDFWMVKP